MAESTSLSIDSSSLNRPTGARPTTDYLSWDEYFMTVACVSAMRSKDPVTQVGACIINSDQRIVGIGYNGLPLGCSDDKFPWTRFDPQNPDPLKDKYLYVCHAEMNAIMNAHTSQLRGCTMYVCLFPCNECAKMIIQAGISQVVFLASKDPFKRPTYAASLRLFDSASVRYRRFTLNKSGNSSLSLESGGTSSVELHADSGSQVTPHNGEEINGNRLAQIDRSRGLALHVDLAGIAARIGEPGADLIINSPASHLLGP